jgi:hypothetical protein
LTGVDLLADPDKLLNSMIGAKELAATFATFTRPVQVETAVRRLNGAVIGLAGVQAIYEKISPGAPKVTQGLTIPAADRSGCATPSNAGC